MKEKPMLMDRRDICAGIVTYNAEINRLREALAAILPQVQAVVIIDNASNNIGAVRELVQGTGIVLVENAENSGIARALDQMCLWAEKEGYSWILTLDHDSICSQNLIKEMIPYTEREEIGIITPLPVFDVPIKVKFYGDCQIVEACMSSASLTRVSAWRKVGGYDEWMFIDYVDNDFCMRLRNNGYTILRLNYVTMNHILGRSMLKTVFGKYQIVVHNYPPIRNYYYVRNIVYFTRKYGALAHRWKQAAIIVTSQAKKLFFEKSRKETFESMTRGLRDGFRVDIGRLPKSYIN